MQETSVSHVGQKETCQPRSPLHLHLTGIKGEVAVWVVLTSGMLRKAYTFEQLLPFSVDDRLDVKVLEVLPPQDSNPKSKYQEIIDLTGDVPQTIFCLASTDDDDDGYDKVRKVKKELTSPSISTPSTSSLSTSSLSTSSLSESSLSSWSGKAVIESKLRLRKRGICRAGVKVPPASKRKRRAPRKILRIEDAVIASDEAELVLGASCSPKRCRRQTQEEEPALQIVGKGKGKGKGKVKGKGKGKGSQPEH